MTAANIPCLMSPGGREEEKTFQKSKGGRKKEENVTFFFFLTLQKDYHLLDYKLNMGDE